MGKQIRLIKWDENALKNFIEILDYIKLESPTNAIKVKSTIINLIKAIPKNPEMYRVDELKSNNDGTFRVFNRDSIRVSYKIQVNAIVIVRVRHTSVEPIQF